jgi:4-oxalocrotonate tautomerase
MPHVIIKMLPGRSEEQKTQLANTISKDIVAIVRCGEESVSVTIEDVQSSDWTDKVYETDISDAASRGTLYRRPAYDPFK